MVQELFNAINRSANGRFWNGVDDSLAGIGLTLSNAMRISSQKISILSEILTNGYISTSNRNDSKLYK